MPKFDSYAQGTPSYVELITPDPRAAMPFYAGLFGWDYEEVPLDDQGSFYVPVTLDGDSVAGIGGQMPELAGHPAFWGVYLAVDDVDATVAKVAGAGGKVEGGPFDVMEHGRMAAIQDPTAARVNLWQANKHVGTARANEPGTPIWNELVTPDVATATKFYSDILGVSWETMPMDDSEYVCLVVEDRMVGGACPPTMEGAPPHWNVYFNVTDVDSTARQAEELGGSVVAPAFDVAGVGRMAVLSDPQGAMFNLMANPPADEA
jgi:predicted enzyme related to lactoylglutathione lyase